MLRQSHSTIYKAVLNGSMKSILDEVKAGLAQGMEPGMIVSDELIPAINEVGDLFEQQKYFLPQLIASAETMKKAMSIWNQCCLPGMRPVRK